jgi:hypothetical protein
MMLKRPTSLVNTHNEPMPPVRVTCSYAAVELAGNTVHGCQMFAVLLEAVKQIGWYHVVTM